MCIVCETPALPPTFLVGGSGEKRPKDECLLSSHYGHVPARLYLRAGKLHTCISINTAVVQTIFEKEKIHDAQQDGDSDPGDDDGAYDVMQRQRYALSYCSLGDHIFRLNGSIDVSGKFQTLKVGKRPKTGATWSLGRQGRTGIF